MGFANFASFRHRRIINHRLVEDGLKLFARDQRQRKQTRASSSGQNDAFHQGITIEPELVGGIAGVNTKGFSQIGHGTVGPVPSD